MRRRWSDRSSRRVRTLVTQLARSRLIRESGRMRADIHDGPEQTLQSEAGYSNARPHQPGRRNLLHRTAGPYSWVIRVGLTAYRRLPLYRYEQTSLPCVGMSQMCQSCQFAGWKDRVAIRSPRRRERAVPTSPSCSIGRSAGLVFTPVCVRINVHQLSLVHLLLSYSE
jgi:hypothetical protein